MAGGVALFLLIAPLAIRDDYFLHILVMVLFYAYAGLAWNIVSGYTGHLSLGHAAWAGIGGYTSTLLFMYRGLTPWVGMLVGGLVATAVGAAISYPCFRLRGPYFTLSTIAFAEILRIWVENTEIGPFGIDLKGAMGLLVPLKGHAPLLFQFDTKAAYYYVALALFLVAVLISVLIERSKFGFYLSAIRSDQDAAESLGIRSARYKVMAMAISCFLTALCGSFYAQLFRYINPTRIFGLDLSVEIASVALVGGQGRVLGPILGSFILTPVNEIVRGSLGGSYAGLHLLVYGMVLIVVVLFLPKGIVGLIDGILKKDRASTQSIALVGEPSGSASHGKGGAAGVSTEG